MSGYSGTHLFQDRAYNEIADGVPAYTQGEYQCEHSQRSYLFQWEDYPQRTLYDPAGAGGCCGEPVLPFSGKPQWADMDEPARVSDCKGRAADTDCDLEIGVPSRIEQCAEITGSIEYEGIVVRCPGKCTDLSTLPNDGAKQGNHGQFVFGDLSEQEMYLKYLVDPSIIAGHYNACSGVADYVEIFCGQGEIIFTLKAGLDSPDGCGCDCCGDNGVYPAPVTVFTKPTPVATYENTIDLSGENVRADQACPGGSISLNALFIADKQLEPTVDHEWTVEPSYHSDGVTRYLEGTPGEIGDDDNSACCGGNLQWAYNNGCSTNQYTNSYWNKWPTNPAVTLSGGVGPSDMGIIYQGESFGIGVSPACGYSATALLGGNAVGFTDYCISGDPDAGKGDVVSEDGAWYAPHSGLSLVHSSDCKKCCGGGGLYIALNDGCDWFSHESIIGLPFLIQNRPTLDSTVVGRVFRCRYVTGNDYRVDYQDLRCNGDLTGGWTEIPSTSQPTWGDCTAQINGATRPLIVNHCGYAGGDCATCCHFAKTYSTGSQFRSRILCLDDTGWATSPTCCDEKAQLADWGSSDHPWDQSNFVNNSGDCCPANRPYRLAA